MNEIHSELVTIEAVNIHPTIKDFKAHVNSKGNIGTERNSTPFKQILRLKRGARIMLTYNIDVIDCLTNGARGKIVDFVKDKCGYVQKIIVKFDEICQGEQKRLRDKPIGLKYPGCTSIERVMYQYSLGKKISSAANTAKIVQFPLCLSFPATAHKIQGQTVVKPQKLAVDLKSVFGPAMTYVMLSRVQSMSQLFILGSLPVEKFYADQKALEELDRLEKISMNKNPSGWETEKNETIKIFCLNCQSLKNKVQHIRDDLVAQMSDVICLSETWLHSDSNTEDIQIYNYELKLNSNGSGKA